MWQRDNLFRVLPKTGPSANCMAVESGITDATLIFRVEPSGWWGGPLKVVSMELPVDPFYGWSFVKQ